MRGERVSSDETRCSNRETICAQDVFSKFCQHFFVILSLHDLRDQSTILRNQNIVFIISRHTDESTRVCLSRIDHGEDYTCVRVKLNHEESKDEDGLQALWMVLLPLVRDFDNLLQQYSGQI